MNLSEYQTCQGLHEQKCSLPSKAHQTRYKLRWSTPEMLLCIESTKASWFSLHAVNTLRLSALPHSWAESSNTVYCSKVQSSSRNAMNPYGYLAKSSSEKGFHIILNGTTKQRNPHNSVNKNLDGRKFRLPTLLFTEN